MMVRSAAKSVSNTRSKPSIRSAVTILPVLTEPGGRPKASPIATRTAGAVWTTTVLAGSFNARQTGYL